MSQSHIVGKMVVMTKMTVVTSRLLPTPPEGKGPMSKLTGLND